MIAIVAERGYEAVKVRELARLAGVSTRTFYQHYSSKEECFLRIHRLIVHRVLGSVETSQAGLHDHRERTRRGVGAIMREWASEPKATQLILIDAYAAGPAALKQARRAERSIALRIGTDVAVVAGLISVVRSRLLGGEWQQPPAFSDELTSWALSYQGYLRSYGPESFLPVQLNGDKKGESQELPPTGEIAFLLSATVKLAVTEGREKMTARKIIAAAGVPHRCFSTYFPSPEACLVMALELKAWKVIYEADRASEDGATAADKVSQVVAYIRDRTAQDPALAKLCFGEIETFGVEGLRAQARLLHKLSALIVERISGPPPNQLALYASAGALWSTIATERPRGPGATNLRSSRDACLFHAGQSSAR